LSKNSLLFLKEFSTIRGVGHHEVLGTFVRIVFPITLIKTTYEKNFIVTEAKQSMQNAVQHLALPELVDVLVEGCQAKNLALAEYSIGYLSDLVKNMAEDYFLSGSISSKQLIVQLLSEYDGKRMKMKKGAESIFKDIKGKVGSDNIERMLLEALGDSEQARSKIATIMKLFEEKAVKKADKSHDFRSFLKQ
jgi:hypothetical protein